MRILVFGAGAIGSIYGYFLSQSNNEVLHYVRDGRARQLSKGLRLSILDGRSPKDVKEIESTYPIHTITGFDAHNQFDLILVSIKHGSLDEVLRLLNANQVKGDIVFFNLFSAGQYLHFSPHGDSFLSRGSTSSFLATSLSA